MIILLEILSKYKARRQRCAGSEIRTRSPVPDETVSRIVRAAWRKHRVRDTHTRTLTGKLARTNPPQTHTSQKKCSEALEAGFIRRDRDRPAIGRPAAFRVRFRGRGLPNGCDGTERSRPRPMRNFIVARVETARPVKETSPGDPSPLVGGPCTFAASVQSPCPLARVGPSSPLALDHSPLAHVGSPCTLAASVRSPCPLARVGPSSPLTIRIRPYPLARVAPAWRIGEGAAGAGLRPRVGRERRPEGDHERDAVAARNHTGGGGQG